MSTPEGLHSPEHQVAQRLLKIGNKTGSETITPDEIRSGIQSLGLPLTEDELLLLTQEMDANSDGVITADEFRLFVVNRSKIIRHLFAQIDKDGDGVISPSDLRASLRQLGLERNRNAVERLRKRLDKGSVYQRDTFLTACQIKTA